MLKQFARSFWESLVFPFVELNAASERKGRQREAFRARGLCSHCGAEPPLEGEDECYTCDEHQRGL
jgi:hypothetical protein